MGALFILTKPEELGSLFVSDNIEFFITFLTLLIIWLFTEYFQSEEAVLRTSTPNDINVGHKLICYSAFQFREILKNQDFYNGFAYKYASEISGFSSDVKIGAIYFQDKKMDYDFDLFCKSLESFVTMVSIKTSPKTIGNSLRSYVRDPDNMEWSETHLQDAADLNKAATELWVIFEKLIDTLKTRIPEASDSPIEPKWFYYFEDYET